MIGNAFIVLALLPAMADAPSAAQSASRLFPASFKVGQLPAKGRWAYQSGADQCALAAWSKGSSGNVGLWAVHPSATNDYLLTALVPLQTPESGEQPRPRLRLSASKLARAIESEGFVNRYAEDSLEAVTVRLDRAQMEKVLASRVVTIAAGGGPDIRVRLDGRGSMASLLKCERSALQAYGLDPSLPDKLSRWPTFDPPSWTLFSDDDYPPSAAAIGAQGTVRVQLLVGTSGRAEACQVVTTSGNAALDTATCRILVRRAKLRPALDKAGKPVAGPVLSTITWRLAEEAPQPSK